MTEQTTTVTVPFTIRKRGGRKLVITPDGTGASPAARARIDSALLKALARGFRWRKLLETGDFATIEEIADAENINPSYVSRLLRMTLLAPEIVEEILAGRQPEGLTMARAMQPFPLAWRQQALAYNHSSRYDQESTVKNCLLTDPAPMFPGGAHTRYTGR
ncbi:hypothetical protein [Aestuariivirga sp.]|jgi:hypothetical protein|uniref:hypothetical protein n=1 Tax=Aestuariivirga sp. TaxID=2650926 RepID=UPI0037850E8D